MIGVMYGRVNDDMAIHDISMWILFVLLPIAITLGLPAKRKRKLWGKIFEIDKTNHR